MTRTKDQIQAAARLHALLDAAEIELRVTPDQEGWPVVPGKYGQLEWLGAEVDGSERVYVFSDRRNVVPRLRAVRGLHPHQTGDIEARFWLMANDAATLTVVAKLIRAHRRRPGASLETLTRARAAAMDALIEGTARRQTAGMSAYLTHMMPHAIFRLGLRRLQGTSGPGLGPQSEPGASPVAPSADLPTRFRSTNYDRRHR